MFDFPNCLVSPTLKANKLVVKMSLCVVEKIRFFFTENKGYDILPAYIVDKPNNTVTMFNASSEVCLEHLFWNFTCYAAEYNVKFLECLLFCTPLLLLPESIQLQWSPGNLTTVVKTSSNSKHVLLFR